MAATSIGIGTLGDVPLPRLVGLAQLADATALSSLWITDEPFFRGAVPSAVACAAATSRLRIGLGVVNPYDHPPVWMAKDFATLQELAGGRAVLGVGACWAPPIEAQGMKWVKPLNAVRDTLAIVRPLLAGEICTYQGDMYSASEVKLDFDPPASRSSILVASMFPRSLEQSGEIADGVILSILCPAAYVERARALLGAGAARSGRSMEGFEIVQYVPMEISEDGESARRSLKHYLAFFIRHSYGSDPVHWEKVAEIGDFDLEEFDAIFRQLRSGKPAESAVPNSFVDRFAVAGTPRSCLELLEAYKHAGTTELVALAPPWANLEQQVTTIGKRLAPVWTRL
jgi:5,10-methylenetetrahydromethanopterin reductase